jgi:hypothetical protein
MEIEAELVPAMAGAGTEFLSLAEIREREALEESRIAGTRRHLEDVYPRRPIAIKGR